MDTAPNTESFDSVAALSDRVLVPKSTLQRWICYGQLKTAANNSPTGRMTFNKSDLDALRRESVARFAAKSASLQFTAKELGELNRMRSKIHRTKFSAQGPVYHMRGRLSGGGIFGSR